jgi:hypothetical protein
MCVNESDVKKLADEAIEWVRKGIKPPINAVSTVTASKKISSSTSSSSKMSKNKKKKLKKKEKHQQLKLLEVCLINFLFVLF